MKNLKVFSGIACVSAMMIMAGCTDSNSNLSTSGTGRVAPVVEVNTSAKASKGQKAPASRVDYDQVSADMLSLRLIPSDEAISPEQWDAIADFPTDKEFPIGKYTLEAFYGNATDEGFDAPYYMGSTQFYVRENETTPVAVTATLQQAIVTVDYTEAFKSYVLSYGAELLSDGSIATVEYSAEREGDLAYMKPGKISVYVNLTVPNQANSAKLKACEFEAKARYMYNVSVDYNNGGLGNEQFIITISDELVTEEVTIDISNELFAVSAPEITTSGFTSGSPLEIVAGDNPSEPLKVTIIADGGLGEVNLATSAPALTQAGWPASANLLTLGTQTQNAMTALGLNAKGLWKNPDKMAVLDFTNVVKNLTSGSENMLPNEFVLTAVDKNGKASDPMVLTINVEKLEVSIVSVADVNAGETEIALDIDYNGQNFMENAKFEVTNTLGTWSPAEIVSATPVSRSSARWHVVLKVAPIAGEFHVRVTMGNGTSAVTSDAVVKPGVKFSIDNNEVWATRAKVHVTDGLNDLTTSSHYWISTDGTNYSPKSADAQGYLTDLNPGTKYYVKGSDKTDIDEARGPIAITTEDAAQLENGNMESWSVTEVSGHSKYQKLATCNGPWDTMNELTTSQGGTGNSIFSYGGSAYRAFSGTWPATKLKAENYADAGSIKAAHNGESAYISTVGWGSGNTSFGSSGKCENVTAGELYLGSYNSSTRSPDYGMSFSSRPASLSFYAMYIAKSNSDYGLAEIFVLDASDEVIATGSKQLYASSSYELITIPLTYAKTDKKAATLKVIFKSSGNTDCLKWTSDCLSDPGSAKYNSERYKGSELYIDDITLNY